MAGERLPFFCAYENRPQGEDGVRVLVASLMRAMPAARLRLYHNPASADFAAWIARYPGVDWRPAELPAEAGWNVKPSILLAAFDDGHEDVVWLDSDILVTRDLAHVFADAPVGAVIVTEEGRWGGRDDRNARRTRGWNLPVGRGLPYTANSCFLRVPCRHRDLVETWATMLERPEYRAAQAGEWTKRPIHMMGDQDVLSALLGSTHFAHVPVRFMRRGRDILQLFGPLAFTLRERAQVALFGPPLIIHAQGIKPWKRAPAAIARRWYAPLFGPYQDVSPYVLFILFHLPELHGLTWLKPNSRSGALMRRAGRGSLALTGASLAGLFDLVYVLPALRNRLQSIVRSRALSNPM